MGGLGGRAKSANKQMMVEKRKPLSRTPTNRFRVVRLPSKRDHQKYPMHGRKTMQLTSSLVVVAKPPEELPGESQGSATETVRLVDVSMHRASKL